MISIIPYIIPFNNHIRGGYFIIYQPASNGRCMNIGPKRSNHSIWRHRKPGSTKSSVGSSKRNIPIVVNIQPGIIGSVKAKSKREAKERGRRVIISIIWGYRSRKWSYLKRGIKRNQTTTNRWRWQWTFYLVAICLLNNKRRSFSNWLYLLFIIYDNIVYAWY